MPARQTKDYYVSFSKKPNVIFSLLFDIFDSLLGAIVVVFLLFLLFFRAVGVSGTSMVPTLSDNDWLAITSITDKVEYGDIVVITQPWERDVPIIKRVIATEGQTVDIDFTNGIVYVDGKQLDEPYISEPTYTFYDVKFPLTVGEGQIFVMGDNRNGSLDSRSSKVGLIDENYVLGKAVYRIYPNSKKLGDLNG